MATKTATTKKSTPIATESATVKATARVRKTAVKAAPAVTVPEVQATAKPRVRTVKHKAAANQINIAPIANVAPIAQAPVKQHDRHEEISRIAYGYWVARGFANGNPTEDWLRAEAEYQAAL